MRRGLGKTPVKMINSPYYYQLVRAIQVMDEFDRIGLSVILKVPFGNVSRVLSELENEGYISRIDQKKRYSQSELKRNPDLKGFAINYGKGTNVRGSMLYTKSDAWSEFMTRWRAFVIEQNKRSFLSARADKAFDKAVGTLGMDIGLENQDA